MNENEKLVFDYRALRLAMGIIAFLLPILVSIKANVDLTSISASYHTDARDIFVGLLFFVAAFLWAYNGHHPKEGYAAKGAALASVLVAVLPTACDGCATTRISIAHFGAAIALFSILAWFCFWPLRQHTRNQVAREKKRRDWIYWLCGWTMVLCMLVALGAKVFKPEQDFASSTILYWAEFVALWAFAISWITASKAIPGTADADEAYSPFRKTDEKAATAAQPSRS